MSIGYKWRLLLLRQTLQNTTGKGTCKSMIFCVTPYLYDDLRIDALSFRSIVHSIKPRNFYSSSNKKPATRSIAKRNTPKRQSRLLLFLYSVSIWYFNFPDPRSILKTVLSDLSKRVSWFAVILIMSRSTDTPEKKPPTLPRRKRSHVSIRSERSDYSGNRSTPSIHDVTLKTVELTPCSHGSLDEFGPSTPANSRQLLSPSNSASNSAESGRSRQLPLNEEQLASKLNGLSTGPSPDNFLTKPKIRAFFSDWYEDYELMCGQSYETWSLFFERYYSSDFVYVRPSGNPLDRDSVAKMLSIDVIVRAVKLVSIDSITIMRDMRSAVVLYTCDQVFSYRGTMNEDRAVVSCVLEMRGKEIKVIHEHRTSGRPIPKESRWSSIEWAVGLRERFTGQASSTTCFA